MPAKQPTFFYIYIVYYMDMYIKFSIYPIQLKLNGMKIEKRRNENQQRLY